MSFLDEVRSHLPPRCPYVKLTGQAEEAPGPDGKPKDGDEDWVATHIGRGRSFRKGAAGRADRPESKPQTITDIPDITDSPPLPTKELTNLNLKGTEDEEIGDIPDMEEIPDMEDEALGLEEEDEATVKIVHPSA
jgi:ubiquitin-like-conjugating enzyme ATG3